MLWNSENERVLYNTNWAELWNGTTNSSCQDEFDRLFHFYFRLYFWIWINTLNAWAHLWEVFFVSSAIETKFKGFVSFSAFCENGFRSHSLIWPSNFAFVFWWAIEESHCDGSQWSNAVVMFRFFRENQFIFFRIETHKILWNGPYDMERCEVFFFFVIL